MAEWVKVGDSCFNLDNMSAVIRAPSRKMVVLCGTGDGDASPWPVLRHAEAEALWRYLTKTRSARDPDKMQRRTYVITECVTNETDEEES